MAESRGRDGAGASVLVPAGGKEAVTAEVRLLALAEAAHSAPDEGMDRGEVEVSILARAEVKRDILDAARHLASVEEAGPVKAEAQVLVPVEVGECALVAARNLTSAGDVDSAPAPERVEVPALVRAEVGEWTPAAGQAKIKMDQAEVRTQVAVRALALAGRVVGSVPTDVRMLTCLLRSSRNRKFHQKRRRV